MWKPLEGGASLRRRIGDMSLLLGPRRHRKKRERGNKRLLFNKYTGQEERRSPSLSTSHSGGSGGSRCCSCKPEVLKSMWGVVE